MLGPLAVLDARPIVNAQAQHVATLLRAHRQSHRGSEKPSLPKGWYSIPASACIAEGSA